MSKIFYINAWVVLTASAFAASWGGFFDALALLAFSFAALVLFAAAAVRSVILQTREFKTD